MASDELCYKDDFFPPCLIWQKTATGMELLLFWLWHFLCVCVHRLIRVNVWGCTCTHKCEGQCQVSCWMLCSFNLRQGLSLNLQLPRYSWISCQRAPGFSCSCLQGWTTEMPCCCTWLFNTGSGLLNSRLHMARQALDWLCCLPAQC